MPTTSVAIPQVKGLPFLGNSLSLLSDAMGFLVKSYHAYGPVYQVQAPGRTITILAGPAANQLLMESGNELFRLKPIYGKLVEETASDLYLPTLDAPE